MAFIGLNPSTADANKDDPTVRRCINFAKAWGFDGFEMLNLWPHRSTDPAGLWPELGFFSGLPEAGTDALEECLAEGAVKLVVAAWGAAPKGGKRGREHVTSQGGSMAAICRDEGVPMGALKLTKQGFPGHPLYLPKTLVPREWRPGRPLGRELAGGRP